MTDEVSDQGSGQSLIERVANSMGITDEAPAVVETAAEPDLFELDFGGEKFQVPSKLKDAFMKNEDYTKKTQELSAQRQALDQVRTLAEQRQMDAAFGDSIKNESQEISVIDAYLKQAQSIDWSSMTTDQMFRQKIEIDKIKDRRSELQQAITDKRSKFQDEVKAKISELRGKSRELASKSISGFSEKAEQEMRAFASAEGLADAEIDNVLLDPRSYRIIWKAAQFDKVQAGTVKAAATADTLLKPSGASNKMPADVRAKLDYAKDIRKAPTSAAKAQLIEQRIAGMFAKG